MKKMFLILLVMILTVIVAGALAEENIAEEPLTVLTCPELSEILQLKNPGDEKIKAFAENFAGQTIAFDANIAYVSNHGSYKTRYDILVYSGDYSEETCSGPNFQFSDVGIRDLGISDLYLPDFVKAGSNVRVVAEVEEYKEMSELFILDPVLVEERKAEN